MTAVITRLGHDTSPADNELQQLLGLYQVLNPADPPLPAGTARDLWHQVTGASHLHYYGIWQDECLASTCNLALVPNLTRSGRPFGVIENVVTHPDFRRRGLGTTLLRHACGVAESLGCYKIMLMTGRADAATLAFYEQAGFEPGRKQAFVRYLPPSLQP